MSTIYDSVEQLVGNTPLLRLSRLASDHGWRGDVLAKLEYLNPAGSAKDRLALTLIDDAEARGELKPGGAIIEPTSGNTGIGLAMVAAARATGSSSPCPTPCPPSGGPCWPPTEPS